MEKICGIYKITNTVNGKVYIGQSIDIKKRWTNHKKDAFWQKAECYQYPLYKAMRKYGLPHFDFSILEECSREQLNEREIFYIQQYHSNEKKNGYNQTLGGDTQEHAKKLSDDDIDKIITRLKTSYDSANIICKEFGVSATLIRDINRGDVYRRDNETYPIRLKLYKLAGYYESQGRTAYSTSLTPVKSLLCPKTKTTATTFSQKYQRVPIHNPTKPLRDICPICGNKKASKATICSACWTEKKHRENAIAQCPEPLELAKLITEKGFEAVGRDFGVSGKAIVKWCTKVQIPTKRQDIAEWYYKSIGLAPPIKEQSTPKYKMSDRIRPVHQINLQTKEIVQIFDCPTAAAKSISDKADATHIAQVCRGKRKSAYGYYWQYADEENT